jgi:hypothetical protein
LNSPRKPALLLTVASLVVMGAAIGPCSPDTNCVSYQAFAVALSTISAFLGLVMLFGAHHMPGHIMLGLARFLLIWWVLGCLIVTFGGPFVSSGNGYFASFFALICSMLLVQSVTHEQSS